MEMKAFSTWTSRTLVGLLFLNMIACAGSQELEQDNEKDSTLVEETTTIQEAIGQKLVLGELELNMSPGIQLIESENNNQDSLISLEVEMGTNPLDIEFSIAQNGYDDLKIEQQEEMHFFISIDGKQCEPDPILVYQSSWYLLPYVLSQKFRLTTFKEENDLPFQDLDFAKLKAAAKATCGEDMASVLEPTVELSQVPHEILTTKYLIRIEAKKGENTRRFLLEINVPTGC